MLDVISTIPSLLAWRPFLDPIDVHNQWYLTLIPLALLIAMTYKAVRLNVIGAQYVKHVVVMTVQIIGAMAALAVASYVLVLVVLPLFR